MSSNVSQQSQIPQQYPTENQTWQQEQPGVGMGAQQQNQQHTYPPQYAQSNQSSHPQDGQSRQGMLKQRLYNIVDRVLTKVEMYVDQWEGGSPRTQRHY